MKINHEFDPRRNNYDKHTMDDESKAKLFFNKMKNPSWVFIFFTLLSLLLAWGPLSGLIASTRYAEYYSHILLIPIVSAYLIFRRRDKIFADEQKINIFGLMIAAVGIGGYFWDIGIEKAANQSDYIAVKTFSAWLFWVGGWIACYGMGTLRRAAFPVLFLLFMVPIPHLLMEEVIYLLQKGSAEAVDILFGIVGLTYAREGFVFQLPTVAIEVAKQCSGIRSTLALFITGVLASHLFLRRGWQQAVFIAAIFPITIIKNAIRILTLTLLGVHVDIHFLTDGFLHRSGGFVFFIPALLLAGCILFLLRKADGTVSRKQ